MILGGLIGTFANGYGSEYNLILVILATPRNPMLTTY
jgi:hypothetical protein